MWLQMAGLGNPFFQILNFPWRKPGRLSPPPWRRKLGTPWSASSSSLSSVISRWEVSQDCFKKKDTR